MHSFQNRRGAKVARAGDPCSCPPSMAMLSAASVSSWTARPETSSALEASRLTLVTASRSVPATS
eukprot:4628797-Pyramimonas_sp.AAC.1